MKKILSIVYFLLICNFLYSQESSIRKVVNSYDLEVLKKLELKYNAQFALDYEKSKIMADSLGLSENIFNKDGSVNQLVGLIDQNNLKYFSIDNNITAAASTRTNYLNSSYNLFGQGLRVGVWDGGPIRTSHVEFGNRVTIGDGTFALNSNSFHATHVAGTIGAVGINPLAKGMAPQINIKGFDWFNDVSEVIAQATTGMLVSNHSYGVPVENAPAWFIGSYSNDSREWDEVAYNLPYYLMVASAGNNGLDPNPSPFAIGFDKLTGNKTSKNNLVIANSQQASIDSNGNLISVGINSSSSQGPTDDRRIKPDITGQGSGLLSTGDATNSSYLTLSGTSMSAPNVAGSLILLQEYFEKKNDRYMKSATLKGLVCHSADDAGNPGPDAIFGWGLLNCKRAAELILYDGLSSSIIESSISQDQEITYTFKSNGTPFKANICWTDPAGFARNGILNSSLPALVNDLDIRISASGTNNIFYPWRLQNNPLLNATRDGDNNVDNVESVLIDAPIAGAEYTITITHKGTLSNGPQNFSMVVSGIDSTFSLLPLNSDVEVCSNASAVFNLDFKNTNFSSVNLGVTNLPVNSIATFSQSSVVVETQLSLTISNLQDVPNGNYIINVIATKGTEIKNISLNLTVFNNQFEDMVLLTPVNNSVNVSSNSEFSWNANTNADSYRLQISSDSAFQSLIVNQLTQNTSFLVNDLVPSQAYFWRVLPINLCGESSVGAPVQNFYTANNICGVTFSATDFSNSTISSSGFSSAFVPIIISDSFVISEITVNLDISHSSVQELKVFLEGPESIGSPSVLLIDQSCGSFANINGSIKDNANPLICSTNSSFAISGIFKPSEQLSYLNNKFVAGEWKLRVSDGFDGNGGQINNFSLTFCKAEPSLDTKEFDFNSVILYPNPTNNLLNIVLNNSLVDAGVGISIVDVNGRIINEKRINSVETSLNVSNLQSGVYFVRFSFNGKTLNKKFIKF